MRLPSDLLTGSFPCFLIPQIHWRDVHVGDLIRLENKEAVPADVVVLYTSETENVAYIETSQIDGETNLKLRRAVPTLSHDDSLSYDEVMDKITSLRGQVGASQGRQTQSTQDRKLTNHGLGQVECEAPNMRINSFTGVFRPDGLESMPIDIDNIILRGSMVRNTKWLIGFVVYTGDDTKIQVHIKWWPLTAFL